jgi:hypothetical protein
MPAKRKSALPVRVMEFGSQHWITEVLHEIAKQI